MPGIECKRFVLTWAQIFSRSPPSRNDFGFDTLGWRHGGSAFWGTTTTIEGPLTIGAKPRRKQVDFLGRGIELLGNQPQGYGLVARDDGRVWQALQYSTVETHYEQQKGQVRLGSRIVVFAVDKQNFVAAISLASLCEGPRPYFSSPPDVRHPSAPAKLGAF